MKPRLLAACIISLLLGACANKSGQVARPWMLTAHYPVTGAEGFENALDVPLDPTTFFIIKPNGDYSIGLNGFSEGKWTLRHDTLYIAGSQTFTMPVLRNNDQTLLLQAMLKGKKINYEFTAMPELPATAAEDPFSAMNNQWRVRPSKKETEEELRARLVNHLIFWERYFAWGAEKSISYLDVRSTATPIMIYGNGFALKSVTDLPAAWKRCFYDEADCVRANEILAEELRRIKIAWPVTTNKFKFFQSGFQQMEEQL
jgi:hypothetical protein